MVNAMTIEFIFTGRFTFTGGTNVTLRGSIDPNWGWVDAHGQAVSILGALFCVSNRHARTQWWDAGQQTNRPHGWAFSKITNGVIRDLKLWKVWCIAAC